jgi:hypothetical protein
LEKHGTPVFSPNWVRDAQDALNGSFAESLLADDECAIKESKVFQLI